MTEPINFQLGGVNFQKQEVKSYKTDGKTITVFLKNGTELNYPKQNTGASVFIEKHTSGRNELNVLGMKNASIKGSDSADHINLSFCENLNVDVKGGNSMLGLIGDTVNILSAGNKNITVESDSSDNIAKNKIQYEKPPVDLSE